VNFSPCEELDREREGVVKAQGKLTCVTPSPSQTFSGGKHTLGRRDGPGSALLWEHVERRSLEFVCAGTVSFPSPAGLEQHGETLHSVFLFSLEEHTVLVCVCVWITGFTIKAEHLKRLLAHM